MGSTLIRLQVLHEWEGKSIEDLFRTLWQVPKKLIHTMRMEKAVCVNDTLESWNQPLTEGDILSITLRDEVNNDLAATPFPLEVLFEDDHMLIVNKPAGMAVHPNEKNETGTLSNAVAFYLESKGDKRKIRHIHRLDKDTTGAVLFAKHALSHAILDRLLLERKIKRIYWAMAEGWIQREQDVIDKPIGRDRHHPTRRRVSPSGQNAITRYHVLKKSKNPALTLLECSLDTGRTHQIRVHFSSIGHPLAGDRLYGGKPFFSRQALHARKLELLHPFTNIEIKCTAPFLDSPEIFEPYL